jgi:hypothetical protein
MLVDGYLGGPIPGNQSVYCQNVVRVATDPRNVLLPEYCWKADYDSVLNSCFSQNGFQVTPMHDHDGDASWNGYACYSLRR